jgi:hypothetical protein
VISLIVALLFNNASSVVRLHKCGGILDILICTCLSGLPELRAEVL